MLLQRFRESRLPRTLASILLGGTLPDSIHGMTLERTRMKGFARFALPLTLVVLLLASTAQAATITYTTTDLGGGQWQYDYVVSGNTFNAFEGFSVFFDPALYEALTDEATTNSPWLLSVLQPDIVLPDVGIFDAIALADGASIANTFSIRFTYLGIGVPGSQAFELTLWEPFDVNDPNADPLFLDSLGSGETVRASVPEPGVLLLLGGGLAALARRIRKRPLTS